MDVHSQQQRSFNMSKIRDKNTKPEMIVRSIVHRMGFRFSLHNKKLPGKPDIVLSRHKKIIFVHGCFWHIHNCKYGKVKPATNADFWTNKRQGNAARDKENIRKLKQLGWRVLVIWECQIRKPEKAVNSIKRFLEE
ncbi:MAG: very short patch repair endonuclease [Planctomycetes bacterium GWC2_45_44]|nr:MAG: very short patch repair endonuclease [Planctomycetes bacterium GWC2_45_44]